MRGIKPTPLKLYFIATPATNGPTRATPSESWLSPPLSRCTQVAYRSSSFPSSLSLSLSLSLSCAQLHNHIHNVAIRQGSKTAPFYLSTISPILCYRPSRRGVSPYNETPETSLRIRPSGGARYLSPNAFLSFGGCIPLRCGPVASRRGPTLRFFLYFSSSLSLLPCPYPTRDLPSR